MNRGTGPVKPCYFLTGARALCLGMRTCVSVRVGVSACAHADVCWCTHTCVWVGGTVWVPVRARNARSCEEGAILHFLPSTTTGPG